jgi:hypothetical protein
MTTETIKRGTAARLGLRRPVRGFVMLPRSMSEEDVAAFIARFEAARGQGWFVDLSGIDVHSIDMEEQRPRRRRWWRR